jgi:serine/threonine protein kinase
MKFQQLGRYQLMDRIAFGGMAEIYRARFIDEAGQEQIAAVKKVLSHLSEDDEFIQMLVDEARISSLLHHPNIAKVYEFGREEMNYFIAMEFVDGKDLRTILENRRAENAPLPIQHSLYVTICVLRGLHEAHIKKGDDGLPLRIIHRDISPSNVLITYPGEVKLIDFGIAKAVMNRVRTQTGVIKGKVKYMSPEQAMGQELDARSDLFSVGTVLYEMLTNQPPFLAASELDLIFKVRDANVNPPSRQNPNVDRELDAIMLKAMSRTRQGRFQSGEEFAQTLEEYLFRRFPSYHPQELSDLLQKTFTAQMTEERRLFEEELRQARSAPGAAQASAPKATGIAKSGAYPASKMISGTNPTTPRSTPEAARPSTPTPRPPTSAESAKPNPFRPPSSEGIPRFGSGANPALRQSLSGTANPLRAPAHPESPRANTPTPAKGSMPVNNPSSVRLGSSANPAVSTLPAPNRAGRSTAPKIPILGDTPLEDEGKGSTILSPPIIDDDDYPSEANAETINRSLDALDIEELDGSDESESLDTVRMEPVFDPYTAISHEDPSRSNLEALLQNLDLADEDDKDGKPTRVLYKQDDPNKRRTEKKTILARPLRDLLPSPKKPSGEK